MPLQQILFNLIDNALRHHDRTEGEITLDAAEEGAFYRFSVADDGPGIPPEYEAKVFGMFQTLKPRDVKEGSGMGLAIVRKAIQQRGGEIHVSANTPRGSIFTFTWPRPLTGLREEWDEGDEKK
jgi:signal transduction histidine kinase